MQSRPGCKIAWNLTGALAVKAGTVENPVEVLGTQVEGAGMFAPFFFKF